MNYTKLIFSFKKRRHNLLIFRNFTILLTGMILLSTTGALAQKGNVSVNINNGTVKTFIKEIEKQTRYTFVYRNNVLNDQAKVTVNCKNKPLDQVLSQVFTPLNVSYSLNNNTIVLVKQEVQQQKKNEKKTIKGTVTDGKGEPIIGANVIQEGGIGTITDVEGNFTVTADLSTGVSALAVMVGTAHGRYKKAPVLDIQRIRDIREATGKLPLVLHGGSGVPDEQIRMAVEAGIRKVNFATDLCYAFLDQVMVTERTTVALDVFMREPIHAVRDYCIGKIKLLGADKIL